MLDNKIQKRLDKVIRELEAIRIESGFSESNWYITQDGSICLLSGSSHDGYHKHEFDIVKPRKDRIIAEATIYRCGVGEW